MLRVLAISHLGFCWQETKIDKDSQFFSGGLQLATLQWSKRCSRDLQKDKKDLYEGMPASVPLQQQCGFVDQHLMLHSSNWQATWVLHRQHALDLSSSLPKSIAALNPSGSLKKFRTSSGLCSYQSSSKRCSHSLLYSKRVQPFLLLWSIWRRRQLQQAKMMMEPQCQAVTLFCYGLLSFQTCVTSTLLHPTGFRVLGFRGF